MANWRDYSEISEDVVYFRYVSEGVEESIDEVFVWDLDKTYLDTSIDSLTKLLITAVERAFNKKNVPGTRALLQALSKNWTDRKGQNRFPVYFITASPPQLEERISEKFALDNIKPFGCFYKDNLRNLRPSRLWQLSKQVGYKVQALLQLRLKLRDDVRQVFWGDDSESDAIIYNLYSDICARRLSAVDIRHVLKSLSVSNEQIEQILQLQSQISMDDPVEKIYINLAVDTDPDYYLKFGRRTMPSYNTFQVACDLFQDSRLSIEGVYAIAQDMIYNYGNSPDELTRSFDDMIRRKILGETTVAKAEAFFKEKGLFHPSYKPIQAPGKEVRVEKDHVYELEGQFEPWIQTHIDYINDYR
jgi:hypothetical protein